MSVIRPCDVQHSSSVYSFFCGTLSGRGMGQGKSELREERDKDHTVVHDPYCSKKTDPPKEPSALVADLFKLNRED